MATAGHDTSAKTLFCLLFFAVELFNYTRRHPPIHVNAIQLDAVHRQPRCQRCVANCEESSLFLTGRTGQLPCRCNRPHLVELDPRFRMRGGAVTGRERDGAVGTRRPPLPTPFDNPRLVFASCISASGCLFRPTGLQDWARIWKVLYCRRVLEGLTYPRERGILVRTTYRYALLFIRRYAAYQGNNERGCKDQPEKTDELRNRRRGQRGICGFVESELTTRDQPVSPGETGGQWVCGNKRKRDAQT
jgi:hypothetical protein